MADAVPVFSTPAPAAVEATAGAPDAPAPVPASPVTDSQTAVQYDPHKRKVVQAVVLPTGTDVAFSAGIITH